MLRLRKAQNLNNKRILITAGPTWVAIDRVRVISNIATGETGILLAEKLEKLGGKVTLLLGPVGACCVSKKIKLIRFKFFDDLKNIIVKELKSKKYDIVIHSAAVSDFKPAEAVNGKISSDKPRVLKLVSLPKIVRFIRRIAPEAILVMFKLECGVSNNVLIKRAKHAQNKMGADIAVANRINPYRAFIIDRLGNAISTENKNELVEELTKLLL